MDLRRQSQSLRTVLNEKGRSSRSTTERPAGRILIAGGARDPNVLALIEAATQRSIAIVPLLIGERGSPSLTWKLDDDDLSIDGRRLDITAAFVRRDVFHGQDHDADYRAVTWYATLQGWLAASPHIRTLNRGYLGRHTNKLHVLRLARESGLVVPETIVTNAVEDLAAARPVEEMIAKPVPGGGYCVPVADLITGTELRDGVAATPAIVQRKISGPDLRIYRVGGRSMGFRIRSESLDYRTSRSHTIDIHSAISPSLIDRLEHLMEMMGLDWGAADFKIGSGSDDPVFLEVNSDPMFSAFDRAGAGAITDAMLRALLE